MVLGGKTKKANYWARKGLSGRVMNQEVDKTVTAKILGVKQAIHHRKHFTQWDELIAQFSVLSLWVSSKPKKAAENKVNKEFSYAF